MASEVEHVLEAVGPRLRALRRRRGMTLAELSATTGISASTLSRLESGVRRATLELLLPLSRAYAMPLDDLVGAPPAGDPRVHLKPVGQRHGMTFIPLTRRAGGTQAYKIIMAGRRGADGPEPEPRAEELQTHEGHEWLYVLNGRLRLVLGEHDLVLAPGEVAEFDTRLPHRLAPADAAPVELLILFSRSGERVHVRARGGR